MAVPWPEIAAHRERLVRLARRRVPTWEDAEDVASEAMLRCATFEELDETRLAQFLTAVTVRLCADVYRDADRGTKLVRRLDVDDEPSPEDLACAAADADMLRDLLHRLPDNQRAVLVDRAQGLSVTQISHRHSLTYKAVESALSRARATMRTAIASALAFVFGIAEAIRRRPGLETAIPAASVALVATVAAPFLAVFGGIGGGAAALPADRPPARVERFTASTPAVLTRVVAPTPSPMGVTRAVRPPAPAAPRPKPTGTPIDIEVAGQPVAKDDDGKVMTSQDLRDCVDDGMWVRVEIRDDPLTPGWWESANGCGRP